MSASHLAWFKGSFRSDAERQRTCKLPTNPLRTVIRLEIENIIMSVEGGAMRQTSNSIRVTDSGTTPERRNETSSKFRNYLKKQVAAWRRKGTWFRLERQERGLLSLTLRLNIRFESVQLLRAIVGVLKKMRTLTDRLYVQLMKGMKVAWAFSEAAVSWGNSGAREWRHDLSYARYLGAHLSLLGFDA